MELHTYLSNICIYVYVYLVYESTHRAQRPIASNTHLIFLDLFSFCRADIYDLKYGNEANQSAIHFGNINNVRLQLRSNSHLLG